MRRALGAALSGGPTLRQRDCQVDSPFLPRCNHRRYRALVGRVVEAETLMVRTRKTISALKQKQLLQEADSQCPFCRDRDVSTFEFHHIDGDPSNNDLNNLIVACSSCHTRITKGCLSEADVVTKKRELCWTLQTRRNTGQTAVNVNVTSSSFRGDIAQTITKISGVRAPRIVHPPNSVGANLAMKGYIDYLIARYFDYRKADRSYGRKTPFSHAVIHRRIQKEFGAKTFFLPESSFGNLVAFLTRHIDETIQGRRNGSGGIQNYHSFEEHCLKHNL